MSVHACLFGHLNVLQKSVGRHRHHSSVKEQEEENVPADEPKGELPSFEGKRILLVEDNELNREIAMEIIGSTGVVIETAENGREAVEMFERVPEGYYGFLWIFRCR